MMNRIDEKILYIQYILSSKVNLSENNFFLCVLCFMWLVYVFGTTKKQSEQPFAFIFHRSIGAKLL